MMKKLTYQSQVKRLGLIAKEALKHYEIKVKKIELKRYAANATYKITDSHNKNYQLRIHPKEWNTKAAILEEINWMKHILNTTDIVVSRPIRSQNNQYIEKPHLQLFPAIMYCEMFEWLSGRKRWHSINNQYARDLGSLIGKLHKSGQSIDVKHRHDLNIDSLVGTTKAKYYNVEKLSKVNKNQQTIITNARRMIYHQLKKYEENDQNKSGLIHGDVQPNNILYRHNKISIIDFGDCGVGLYAYELATALNAFHHLSKGNQNKKYKALEEALYEGYSKHMSLTDEDIRLMPYCILAIRLVTIGWLEHNKNNVGLDKHYNEAIAGIIHYFKMLK